MMELCVKCRERPVQIKKHSLCFRCYHRAWINKDISIDIKNPKGVNSFQRQTGDQQKREIEFIKNYFTHNNWIHHPAMFKLNGEKYTPDFYDQEQNVFIEVSGTRQAYEQAKYKYELFRDLYPNINFEIRKPSGELLNEESRDKQWEQ